MSEALLDVHLVQIISYHTTTQVQTCENGSQEKLAKLVSPSEEYHVLSLAEYLQHSF